jgi:hypothetical protein
MTSSAQTPSSPSSPTKRPRDSPFDADIETQPRQQFWETPLVVAGPREANTKDARRHTVGSKQHHQYQDVNDVNEEYGRHFALTRKQQRFLRQWYNDFARPDVDASISEEHKVALATAIEAQPNLVLSYIEQRCNGDDIASHAIDNETRAVESPQYRQDIGLDAGPYTLAEANHHLPKPILTLVEKYVSACRRRRSQNDGRRSVNSGPYRCTFGCGYRTKRAFDWRRHEETHEPQELWLCTMCSHNDNNNPFLVNRKDKFLKHATDKHVHIGAEDVLESSRLAFVPLAELRCPYCGEDSGSWDERCRHVLGHFDDEVERGVKRAKVMHLEHSDRVSVNAESDGDDNEVSN